MRVGQVLVAVVAAAILLPLIIVLAPPLILWRLVWGNVLRFWFWLAHRRQGRVVLFVYSDSPNWQSYIEENVLPRLGSRAVVINWSRRKQWNRECWWEARAFHFWAGSRAFNPIALVFVGWWRVVPVRFFQAFRDLKHGKEEPLRQAEAELLRHLPAQEAAV
jgi:hypothetical protein